MASPDRTRATRAQIFVICLAIGTVIGVSIGIPNQNPVLMIGGPAFGLLSGILGTWIVGQGPDA